METKRARMSVAIVTHNTCECLRACLESLEREAASDVVVVDNASSDDTVEMVRAAFPRVKLLANKTNSGYGAGANQAIAIADAEYVLLLNADTQVQPGTLASLSDYLDQHPQAAIVGPRIVYPDGSPQPSCYPFPNPVDEFLRESTLQRWVRRVPVVRDRYLRTWSHDTSRIVPWVLGAALGIRTQAFEAVGGFDESFFMYSEEVDLAYRLRQAGWQVHFSPAVSVVHVGGASTTQVRAQMLVRLYESLFRFALHHYSAPKTLGLKLVVTYVMLRNMAHDVIALKRRPDGLDRHELSENLMAWRRVIRDIWGRW